ncbi:MAG: DUF4105 domain-containing protein [Sulfurimonas sp.]|nr:DUF4105 domain-containing protein [Sulfurimonas sp.]MBU1217685.1 DUF4105 domain-containing protein [bacterium]MBU1434287.1 DUF4105 domain-containing protein [bacterium]MBU1503678.1 DUF4105 domain-containing protein [bacterium]MBU3939496.1 DUF4105 domain-containing protein [bacterium]
MVDGESEIDDKNFFFATDGKTNAKNELDATLDAFYNEKTFDSNASACKFPARKNWLKEKLGIKDFPNVNCSEYDKILQRLNPKSATLVFPSAHINSPASMFGHTFIRINSAYKSKLLSYAINYAADADPSKTNGVIFALKGLFGGYYGQYSLLPYYEKLKEYRDTEQRDVWEYDLNLNEAEVLRMTEHIWELNGTHSYYYFFTENCSYNMLWLLEVARPSVHLRDYFNYNVIPLETIHAAKEEKIIADVNYRASKRTILLKYEKLLNENHLRTPRALVRGEISPKNIIESKEIDKQQKMYILEASIEYLEYSFSRNSMSKDEYVALFHTITKARASLGPGKELDIQTPEEPSLSHRAIRLSTGFGSRNGNAIGFLGLRPAYHDLEDSLYGFLRGTQIEFANLELSYSQNDLEVEEATILSIASIAQRSEFFDSFSWRTKFGWDKNSLNEKTNFLATLGAGYSWGNENAYVYFMFDPFFYVAETTTGGIGSSAGLVFDGFSFMNTNIEYTNRWYDSKEKQALFKLSQNFRTSQNTQIKLKYDYKERVALKEKSDENTYKVLFNYHF